MRSFLKGFVYAAKGIGIAVKQERNLRFHLCAGSFVFLLSLFYKFNRGEYALLCVLVAGVFALEMTNTALERVVHKPKPERYHLAGVVKDVAAGAVLMFCIGAVAAGLFLFWDPAVFYSIYLFFAGRPYLILVLAAYLALCTWFVFGYNRPQNGKENK